MSNLGDGILGVLIVVCACGDSQSARMENWTASPESHISLVEQVRIDGMAADLVPIGDLAVAEDGSIVVAQRQDHGVRFFSATGTPLGSVGQSGKGPGGFTLVNQLGWFADTLWISDAGQSRASLISPNRAFVRTINLPTRTRPLDPTAGETFTWLSLRALYLDESMLAYGYTPESDALLHVTWNGDLVKVVVRLSHVKDVGRIVTPSGSMADANIFPNTPHYAVSPNGGLVAVARTLEGSAVPVFSVTVMNREADTIFGRDYPFEGVPIPQSVVDSVIAARVAKMNHELATAFKREAYAPQVYPPVTGLLMNDDGSVWVELHDIGQVRTYVLLDDTGQTVGTVTFPPRTVVVAVSGSSIWSFESDQNGVQSIVKYQLHRP